MKGRFKLDDSRILQAAEAAFPSKSLSSAVAKSQWAEIPRTDIREALSHIVEGSSAALAISEGLTALGPIPYLSLLWAELASMAARSEVAAPRQVGFFALTTKLSPPHPALLPLFLSYTVPSYISLHGDSPVHANSTALLANLLASSLLASLHYERSKSFLEIGLPFSPIALAQTLLMELTVSKSSVGDSLCAQIMLYPSFVQHFGILT